MARGSGGQSFYHDYAGGGGGSSGGQWSSPWYPEDADTVLSKKLSQILRHTAAQLGLEVLRGGYVRVRDLLEVVNRGQFLSGYTEADIVRVVRNNTKQRFALDEDERAALTIRANQGHTGSTGAAVDDGSLLTEILSSEELERRGEVCVHGTYGSCWESIKAEGLKPMGRNHVHFAIHAPNDGEVISGMRASCEIFIFLNVPQALEAGLRLYRSSNSVLLSRGFNGVIPKEFFERVVHRWQNKQLWPPPPAVPAPKPLGERRVPGLGPVPAPKAKRSAGRASGGAGAGAGAPRAAAAAAPPSPEAEVPDDWEDECGSGGEAEASAPAAAPRSAERRAPREAEASAPAAAPRSVERRAPREAEASTLAAAPRSVERRAPREAAEAEASAPAAAFRPPERRAPTEARGKAAADEPLERPARRQPPGSSPAAPAAEAEASPQRRWTSSLRRQAAASATTEGAEPCAAAESAAAGSNQEPPEVASEKELRNLQKKLRQIQSTEERRSSGKSLTAEEESKVARKAEIEQRIAELRSTAGIAGG